MSTVTLTIRTTDGNQTTANQLEKALLDFANERIIRDARGPEYHEFEGAIGAVRVTKSVTDPEREERSAVDRLLALLEFAYKFPHNVNLYELLRMVHGRDSDTNIGYLREKEKLIDRKGFTWWYCELDLANQRKVAKAMLKRYADNGLPELLEVE